MKLKRASIFTKIVVIALIVYAAVSLSNTKKSIAEAQEQKEILQAQVEMALQENAELEYDIAHASDPGTIAEIARTKLGLVMPGEKIFYDVSN